MTISPQQVALAMLCRADGTLIEVLYDELDVTSHVGLGAGFMSMVIPSSERKAGRFLRTAIGSQTAIDWDLDVALPRGVVRLFFSAGITGRGMFIVGTKEPFAAAAVLETLSSPLEEFAFAMQSLHKRREAKAESATPLRKNLAQMSESWCESDQAPNIRFQAKKSRGALKTLPEHLELLGSVVHDLRNPISGILATSQCLLDDAASLLSEQHLYLLRSIESSSELLLRMIEDIVDFPTIEYGKFRLRLQPTDLAWVVDRSATINRPLAESKNTRLEIKMEGKVPPINGDPLRLTQAMNVLLADMIKRSKQGGKIEISVESHAGAAVVTVRDRNPRMSLDDLKAIFEPLLRDRASGGLKETRLDLTLAKVKRIIEGHHGAIRVEADAANGLILALDLPRSRHRVPTGKKAADRKRAPDRARERSRHAGPV